MRWREWLERNHHTDIKVVALWARDMGHVYNAMTVLEDHHRLETQPRFGLHPHQRQRGIHLHDFEAFVGVNG
jgi:hypothetical protein